MKSIKTFLVIATVVIIGQLVIYGFTADRTVDTKVFVCSTPKDVQTYIETYAKYGYTVKCLASQSVATDIKLENGYTEDWNYKHTTIIYGKFVLVLEK